MVVNVDWFFVSHRLPIALAAARHGYEVHIATEVTTHAADLEGHGLKVHPLSCMRGGANLGGSMGTFFELVRLFRELRPDIVHLVTVRPVVLGGIAARLVGVPSLVAAISGLGFVFTDSGARAAIRRFLVARLYALALRQDNIRAIFQNDDDRDTVTSIVGIPGAHIEMIRGSGVDLDLFRVCALPSGPPIVMFAARMLRDKGVLDFVEAARLLRGAGDRAGDLARFVMVGSPDPGNPASLSQRELASLQADDIVEVWGPRSDMSEALSQATVVVLPSYREGLPKVLVEAAACGRAVITTDVPGCRDAILPGVTGLLVPPRKPCGLARAIEDLLEHPAKCAAMGRAGRRFAEESFGIDGIVGQHLRIYDDLVRGGRR